jgi:transcription initiation factor TFIIIB Brf1 subunit/transcription initiation factor TFIIB
MSNDFLLFENALNEYNKFNSEENISRSRAESSHSNFEIDDDYGGDDYSENQTEYNTNSEFVKNKRKDSMDSVSSFSTVNSDIVLDECVHKNTITENGVSLCETCGKEIEKTVYQDKEWRYYGQSDSKRTTDPTRVHARKIDDKNIFKDVETMGFSDKITSLANKIYLQVTKGQILRGNSRKAVIFSCIFHAFKIMGKPQSHEKLMKIFELNKKSSLKGFKYVNLNAPKDSLIHTTYITPVNLVEDIMDIFNSTKDQKKEIIHIYEKIKNKSSKINRSRPQSIASALVYFWISYKNIDISIKDFAKKVSLSELTILKLSREISDILEIVPECWL